MRFFTTLLLVFFSLSIQAADFAREKKWADEILPSVLDGEPVWLDEADGHKFLGIFLPAAHHPRAAVILVHGIGVHPDWGFISGMRQKLPEANFSTLSVQMPVLAADAKRDAYQPEFERAAARLAKSVDFLKTKGYQRIAIVCHSLGCPMSYRYLSGKPDAAVKLWVPISSPGTQEDLSKLTLPILDIYGEHDESDILKNLASRAKALKHTASTQIQIAKAGHLYEGQEEFLNKVVAKFIDRQLSGQ